METAGLGAILERCRNFQFAGVDKLIAQYDEMYEDDHSLMLKNFDEDILRDMSDPFDVYRAIMASVEGTESAKYFLSAMQHLLLVREDGEAKARYFQLVDSLVTSVVLDKKPTFDQGISNTVGLSVERLVAQFGEHERAQAAEKEATDARKLLGQVRLEKEALAEELASAANGQVGIYKDQIAALEEKLRISRANTEALQEQLLDERRQHEEAMQQLEMQISELFKMLKESRGFASAVEAGKGMERRDLIYNLSKQMERKKTIGILEGRKSKTAGDEVDDGEYSDADSTELGDPAVGTDVQELRKRRRTAERRRRQQAASGVEGGNRTSQFMDAEEERVRAHIEESLAAGAELMVSRSFCWLGFVDY